MAQPQYLPSSSSESERLVQEISSESERLVQEISSDDSGSDFESQQVTKTTCDNVSSALKKPTLPLKPNAKPRAIKAVFTKEDEIALVEGMIEFKETNQSNLSSNMTAFRNFVKNSLSCIVSRTQLVSKISKLKHKFLCNVSKVENGEDPMSWKPHDYKLFELSRDIWGSEVLGGMEKDSKDDHVANKTEAKPKLWWSLYPCLCASLESEANKNFRETILAKEYVNKVLRVLETKKAAELEEEWNSFLVMQQQVYAKRMKLIAKQAEAMMNSSSQ
ncbi:hypothetical protein DCAR_0414452 [Daucus carota subsp. sativus]|uniref:Glabrous enhancer-binding protein-like DBD domain-containing protein n=1 Tax=Daucus carota subsp. sativus TaxID=79200 RepID=A0A175YBY7_DAUCS|nr:PREDICTED: uncharacterized protein LOC108192218 [Daucus carota subsp. sativus]WOG95149.1 hypothetical protein DCAR_0414452 [Daucus carota subsp. sativus]